VLIYHPDSDELSRIEEDLFSDGAPVDVVEEIPIRCVFVRGPLIQDNKLELLRKRSCLLPHEIIQDKQALSIEEASMPLTSPEYV
jgi:hypothetical protein